MTAIYHSALAVTPSDSSAQSFSSLYVGGAGDVAVLMNGDSSPVTFKSVPAGTFIPLCVQKVMATGTTATNILGLR